MSSLKKNVFITMLISIRIKIHLCVSTDSCNASDLGIVSFSKGIVTQKNISDTPY